MELYAGTKNGRSQHVFIFKIFYSKEKRINWADETIKIVKKNNNKTYAVKKKCFCDTHTTRETIKY